MYNMNMTPLAAAEQKTKIFYLFPKINRYKQTNSVYLAVAKI